MTIRYTKDHEYIIVDGETGTVGITDYAQAQLGDVVFVELPTLGRTLTKGEESAVVESVKAASEIYAPASGEVTAINADLEGTPGAVNEDAAGRGWFYKMRIAEPAQLEELMSEGDYAAYVAAIS